MQYARRENFTVRVPGSKPGTPAGVGFVVADLHVVTCAHVVNVAIGRNPRDQRTPSTREIVRVDFPILGSAADAPSRKCHVVAWEPPPVTGVSGGDLAVLQMIDDALPPGAGPARLMDPGAAHGARVTVFGYPEYPDPRRAGGWAWLRVSGGVGGGLVQLDADGEAAFRAQPGYSGSPVVAADAAGDAVIGIFSAASVDGQDPDSYAIPVPALIRAWPQATLAAAGPIHDYRIDPYGGDLGIGPYRVNPNLSFGTSAVRELPLAPLDFSGRLEQRQCLTGWLTTGGYPRIASIYGIAGSGKTALALKVAQAIGADYPDCQLHFDLRASDQSPVSVDTLLGRKLVQLGVPVSEIPTGVEARAEAYRSQIAGRNSLIIVDNVASPDQVRLLLPGYSNAAVIVTSWVPIPELGPHSIGLQPLADDEAAAMLVAVSNRTAGEEDQAEVLEVARLLGGLPLALRIAGGLLRTRELWTWAKLAERIRDESASSRARPPLVIGSPEVQASFGLAYAELKPGTARGYRLLGLAPTATMSRDLAQALISDDPGEAEDVVDELAAHQFLQPETGTALRMHNLLWMRARSLAEDDPDQETRQAAVARLTTWSLNQLRTSYLDRIVSSLSVLPPVPATSRKLSLPETYVDSTLTADPPRDWTPGDTLVDAFPAKRNHLILTAPGGSGKTTMVSYLCVTAAASYLSRTQPVPGMRIPLVVLLRDVRPDMAQTDVESLITSTVRYRYDCELTREALQIALEEGQVFVVFDGFDELIDPTLRHRVMQAVNAFAARYPQVPVLVTTRPFAEVHKAFPDFSVAAIQPWDTSRALTYLQKLQSAGDDGQDIASLSQWLREKTDLAGVGTPLGLQVLLSAYWRLGVIPQTFTLVMDSLIDLMTGGRQFQRGIGPADADSTRRSAETVAFAMQSRPDNRTTISERGIAEAIAAFVGVSSRDSAVVQLRGHAPDAQYIVYELTDSSAGFMRPMSLSPSGEQLYAFAHSAYREHLAASYVARLPPHEVVRVMRSHLADPAWEAVFVTALELGNMWEARSAGRFLEEIESAASRDPALSRAIRFWRESSSTARRP